MVTGRDLSVFILTCELFHLIPAPSCWGERGRAAGWHLSSSQGQIHHCTDWNNKTFIVSLNSFNCQFKFFAFIAGIFLVNKYEFDTGNTDDFLTGQEKQECSSKAVLKGGKPVTADWRTDWFHIQRWAGVITIYLPPLKLFSFLSFNPLLSLVSTFFPGAGKKLLLVALKGVRKVQAWEKTAHIYRWVLCSFYLACVDEICFECFKLSSCTSNRNKAPKPQQLQNS